MSASGDLSSVGGVSLSSALQQVAARVTTDGASLAPALPLLFRLGGKPYDLSWSHFMFEPMFRVVNMPRRMVYITGRQVAKCVSIYNEGAVYRWNGAPARGDDLSVGDAVLCLCEETLRKVPGTVTRIFRLDPRPCIRLRTSLGTVVEVADTHPIRTPSGYAPAGEIVLGGRVAAMRSGGEFGGASVPSERVALTAYMLGDGCCGCSANLDFTALPGETLAHFKDILGEPYRENPKPNTRARSVCLSHTGRLARWLKEDGLWGKRSYEKHFPDWVFDLPRQGAVTFIEALWATDGRVCVYPRKYELTYSTSSRQMAYQLKALLLKFDITSSVARSATRCNGKRCRDTYKVRVYGRPSQERFVQTFRIKDKPAIVPDTMPPSSSNRDTLPREFLQLLYDLCAKVPASRDGTSLCHFGLRRSAKYPPSPEKLEQYIDWLRSHNVDTAELERLRNADVVWDRVVAVERIDSAPCWDIEVETHHNYVLDGLVVHNSTTMAASQVIRTAVQANYNVLTVMPLYEQVRKFSSNYVRPFIVTSPFRKRLLSDSGSDSVLQRQIGPAEHNSALFYSYSHGDPNRVRGIPASEVDFDEIADLDITDMPIIESCMGASPYKVVRYTGTPKTHDNTAFCVWDESSQARWHIPCICGKLNRASADADLINMIGDCSKRPDGSIRTLICASCGRDLDSRAGYFLHDMPERQISFAGYHVPQIVLPMHYEIPSNWLVLLEIMRDKPAYVFYNEVLGEPYDAGAKLITPNQVKEACTAPSRNPKAMVSSEYIAIVTGVDWGGRGKELTSDTEDFISNTAFAVGGMRSDGVVEINWLHKVPYSVDMSREPELAVQAAALSRSEWLAIDYAGQGNVQEQLLRAHGWPANRIVPFTYSNMSPTKPIVFFSKPSAKGVRSSFTLDKTRSLLLLCELIKRKLVLLPDNDRYFQDHLRDFQAIYEESMDSPSGSKRRLVKRIKRKTDDVVHAINFVVMALYHTTGSWPALAQAFMDNPLTIAE